MTIVLILIAVTVLIKLAHVLYKKSVTLDIAVNMVIARYTFNRLDEGTKETLKVKLLETVESHGMSKIQIEMMNNDQDSYWLLMVNIMRSLGIKPAIRGAIHNDEFALPWDAYKKLKCDHDAIPRAKRVLQQQCGVEVGW